MGYQVTVTANGKEAWPRPPSSDAPSLLILDWLMPEMDGVESAGKSASQPSTSPPISSADSRGSRRTSSRASKPGRTIT